MIAKKCDRCGTLYEEYNIKNSNKCINGLMLLNINSDQRYYAHGPYDICPKCTEEFMKWFKKENNNAED